MVEQIENFIDEEIPAAPSSPDRDNDEDAVFHSKVDVFLAFIVSLITSLISWATQANTMAGEMNTVANDMNTMSTNASASAAVALGVSNFKGNWSGLSGTLNVPASVRHNDSYWVLLVDLPDVTTKEPGAVGSESTWAIHILNSWYDTVWAGAGSMIVCTTNGASFETKEYGTNDIDVDVLAFDSGATKERAQIAFTMPEDWDRSSVKVKFYWTNATGASPGDTVEWGIKAGAISNDGPIDAALGAAVTVSDVLIADEDLHITAATGALTVGGTPALGDMIQFEIYRNTDGADDMAEDAYLTGISIQYKKKEVIEEW